MNTKELNRSIKGYLELLSNNIAVNNALGLYDINRNSENLVAKMLNSIFNFKFINVNVEEKQNYPAIDLIDTTNKISVQVTSDTSAIKLTKTCKVFINRELYKFFDRLIFYFLTSKRSNYRNSTKLEVKSILSENLSFDFDKDILNNSIIGSYIDEISNINLLSDINRILEEDLALPNGGKMDPSRGYIIAKRLNIFAAYSLDDLVGRINYLDLIHTKFQINNIVLVTGLGGIGKTTIAKAYLEKYKQLYGHLAYVDITTSIIDAILLRLADVDKSFEYNNSISKVENFAILINKLSTIYNTVLIIDNCNDDDELRILKPMLESLEWKILITSRSQPDSYLNVTIKVKELDLPDAYSLFTNFYTLHDDKEEETIKAIIKKAHYHTKLIVLLAKTANSNPLLTLETIANRVSENAYQEDALGIPINLEQEERSAYEFILMLFNPDALTAYQKHYMRFFSILPSQEIPINHLFELFEGEKDQKIFITTLNKLFSNGWLEKYNNNFYRIHPLVQLVTLKRLNPTFIECSKLINNLISLIDHSSNPLSLSIYLPYCEKITRYFADNASKDIGILLINISKIYTALAQYDNAIDSNISALAIFENMRPIFSEAQAQCYGYLGGIYVKLDIYEQAIEYYKKCLNIQEKILHNQHPDLAATYSNLSILFGKLEVVDLSEYYINEAVKILNFHYFNNYNYRIAYNLAEAYSNLATILDHKGRALQDKKYIVQALRCEYKALIVAKRFASSEHPLFGQIYNNISLTFRNLDEYDKSLMYLSKSMIIREKILPQWHPNVALGYYNYGVLYNILGQYNIALNYAVKALEIQEATFSPEHNNVIATKELIEKITDQLLAQ